MVVLPPPYGENTVFLVFSLMDFIVGVFGILLVIHLEFRERKHQHSLCAAKKKRTPHWGVLLWFKGVAKATFVRRPPCRFLSEHLRELHDFQFDAVRPKA